MEFIYQSCKLNKSFVRQQSALRDCIELHLSYSGLDREIYEAATLDLGGEPSLIHLLLLLHIDFFPMVKIIIRHEGRRLWALNLRITQTLFTL